MRKKSWTYSRRSGTLAGICRVPVSLSEEELSENKVRVPQCGQIRGPMARSWFRDRTKVRLWRASGWVDQNQVGSWEVTQQIDANWGLSLIHFFLIVYQIGRSWATLGRKWPHHTRILKNQLSSPWAYSKPPTRQRDNSTSLPLSYWCILSICDREQC